MHACSDPPRRSLHPPCLAYQQALTWKKRVLEK